MCASNEHTFLYTQVFLYNLEQQGVAGARRLSQEVFVTATDAQHAMAASLAQEVRLRLLQERSASTTQSLPLLRMLKAALAARRLATSDVAELYREYTKPQPPPVHVLWDFELLDLLLAQLFDVHRKLPPPSRQHCLYLLAYASSYTGSPGLDEAARKTLMDALSAVLALCPREVSLAELRAGVDSVVKHDLVRRYPMVAMGVVRWARQNLLDPEFYATNNADYLLPVHFAFLRSVVAHHPHQHGRVLDLAAACATVPLLSDLLAVQRTLRRSAVDLLVDLVLAGCVAPVLAQLDAWGAHKQLDTAYARLFLGELFQLIEPPYDPAFVHTLAAFLEHEWLLAAFRDPAYRTSRGYQGVSAFLRLFTPAVGRLQKQQQQHCPTCWCLCVCVDATGVCEKEVEANSSVYPQKVLDSLKTLRKAFVL